METLLDKPNGSGAVQSPHYLLFSESSHARGIGRWRFRLASAGGGESFEAADIEAELGGERLALLTVVRALEALDQPSRVTLVNCDPYVRRGIRFGLPEWRENGWRWECFGKLVPVKDADLWQRLQHAMQFHDVDCRRWRIDGPHVCPEAAGEGSSRREGPQVIGRVGVLARADRLARGVVSWLRRLGPGMGRRAGAVLRAVGRGQSRRPWDWPRVVGVLFGRSCEASGRPARLDS
jgi:ribonuclease HI